MTVNERNELDRNSKTVVRVLILRRYPSHHHLNVKLTNSAMCVFNDSPSTCQQKVKTEQTVESFRYLIVITVQPRFVIKSVFYCRKSREDLSLSNSLITNLRVTEGTVTVFHFVVICRDIKVDHSQKLMNGLLAIKNTYTLYN